MARKRISIIELETLVREGNVVSQIARKLHVSKGTVSKALKKYNVAVTKDSAMYHAGKIAKQKLDAMDQLKRINEFINKELDHVQESIKTASEEERAILQDQQLKHVAEIRKQLGLLLQIAQTLYNAEAVARFQQTVIEEIRIASPEVRDRILHRLNERRAIRSTLGFS